MISTIKEILQKYYTLILFCVFVLISYIKCLLFEHEIYLDINPNLLSHHLPKIIISIIIGSPILVNKKCSKWYALILSLIIDFWFIANFIYNRYNSAPIDAMALNMIGNMDGFWNSILLFINIQIDVLPILLSCLIIPFFFINKISNKIDYFIYSLLCLYPLAFLSHYMDTREKQYWEPKIELEPTNLLKLFHISKIDPDSNKIMNFHTFKSNAESNSGIHLLLNNLISLTELKKMNSIVTLTDEEKKLLTEKGYLPNLKESKKFDSKLIIIVVESMENWVLTPETMPNLWNYMQNHSHLYASKMISQVRFGSSADGQMIINTGILPLYNGATCYRYPNNTYPALCKLAKGKSLCMVPHELDVWNQVGMSLAYGYDDNMTLDYNDKVLFTELNKYIKEDKYQVIQLLTMSTHSPFDALIGLSKFTPEKEMPIYGQNYLKSFHYFDENLGIFLNKIDSCEAFKNLTIVITGDHTIFPDDKREELREYSKTHNKNYNPEAYTCAIIFSPKLNKKTHIDCVSYQMDIYPTITSLLDCGFENYKGIGKNLLERDNTTPKLEYNEELKYSNLIISSNFFNLIK